MGALTNQKFNDYGLIENEILARASRIYFIAMQEFTHAHVNIDTDNV